MYSHERFQADLVHSSELLINSNIGTMQARLLREHNEHVRIVVLRLCIVDPRKPNILWSIICNAIRVTNIRSIDLRIHISDLLDELFHVLLRGPGHLLDGQMGDVLLLLKLVHDRVTISPGTFVYICRYDLLRQTRAIYSNCNNR